METSFHMNVMSTYRYPSKEDVEYFKKEIPLGTHRHKLHHAFENSFTGKQAMQVIQTIDGFHDIKQAIQFGNLMILSGVMEAQNFRLNRFFTPKRKYIYKLGQGEGFENLFWLYKKDDDGESNTPATLAMEDYSKELIDEELTPEEMNELKDIPTVRGLPIAGVALKIATPGDMNRSMQRLGRELCPKEGGIFRMTLMGNKFVVVSDPDIVKTVFVSDNFGKKTEHDTFFHELRVFRGEGLSTASDGCVHQQCQGLIAPQLVKKCFDKYVPTILSVVQDSMYELRKTGTFEARPFFSKIMTRIIGKVTLGIDLYASSEWRKFVKGITFVADQSVNRAFKASKLAPNQALKFKRTVDFMNDLLLHFVQERREKRSKVSIPEEEYDMLDLLLTTPIAENDGQKIYMSDELIRANLETIISAQNTTVSMLSWTLNFLYDSSLGNTSYLYKLLQEVDNISQGDRSYQPTIDDVYKRMTYMTNILWETLRLCPPIPTVIRHCIKTCNLDGYLVRRGTTFMVSALGTHLNPKSFDDPLPYNPERWNKSDVKKRPCSFVVWAAGKRQCVGREYALLTGRLAFFCLLNQFSLEMSPKAKVVTNEHLFVFPDGLIMNARARPNVEPLTVTKDEKDKDEKHKEKNVVPKPNSHWEGLVNLIQKEKYKVVVFKGTNSSDGTVETVANWYTEKLSKLGFNTGDSPVDPNDFLSTIKDDKPGFTVWIIVVASYNGKPPKNTKAFYDWLKENAEGGEDSKYLKNIRYCVFGCGSTNWVATYRKIPTDIDKWMEALGAQRIFDPAEFNEAEDELEDVIRDYYTDTAPPMMRALPAISSSNLRDLNEKYGGEKVNDNSSDDDGEDFSYSSKLEAKKSSSAAQLEVMGTTDDTDLSFVPSVKNEKHHDEVTLCKIKKITNLTPNSDRTTLSIELDRSDLDYQAGDHLVVFPVVSKEYAERLLKHFVDFDLDTVVSFKPFQSQKKKHFHFPTDTHLSVENILCSLVDLLQKPSKQFIMNYSAIVEDKEREELSKIANDRKAFKEWIKQREPISIIDVIDSYPPVSSDFDRLLGILPPLEPRTFSITNAPKVHENEIHLCAVIESKEFENGTIQGLCSQYWLSLEKQEGAEIYAYVEEVDESFRVPDDEKPMILISAGTGFAPMRSFLHERKYRGSKGKNVVIFGCRTEENDMLYKDELKEWEESGFADVHYAFSRSKNCKKTYVQDVMKEIEEDLWDLVDKQEAHIFVCGAGSTMAAGVRDTLIEIIQNHTPEDKEKEEWANNYIAKLEEENRYEIDVWG